MVIQSNRELFSILLWGTTIACGDTEYTIASQLGKVL
jgi:hypothetical protein